LTFSRPTFASTRFAAVLSLCAIISTIAVSKLTTAGV
jgi:hypothetical protein